MKIPIEVWSRVRKEDIPGLHTSMKAHFEKLDKDFRFSKGVFYIVEVI